MAESKRIACCVPFCRRTASADRFPGADEWICEKHWPLVPRKVKLLKRRVEARMRRKPTVRNHEACMRVWDMCKRYAMPIR